MDGVSGHRTRVADYEGWVGIRGVCGCLPCSLCILGHLCGSLDLISTRFERLWDKPKYGFIDKPKYGFIPVLPVGVTGGGRTRTTWRYTRDVAYRAWRYNYLLPDPVYVARLPKAGDGTERPLLRWQAAEHNTR